MKKRVGVVVCVIVGLLALTFGATAQTNQAWIPGVASLALPGLGQLLNDQIDKALWHFGVAVALNVGAYYVSALLPFPGVYGVGLVYLAWGLYSGYDAYTVAKERGFRIGVVENGIGFAVNF